MIDFIFNNPTKIIFGRDTELSVGLEAKRYANRVLLHYGGGSIKKTGLYDKVIKSLKDADIKVFELSGVQPNPRLSLVQEGIKICRENNIELVLAVGGGSVIDSSKAIAVGVPYEGNVWDFFMGKSSVEKSLPVGTVLTLPAAGSEASNSAVITNEDGWYKVGLSSSFNYPVFSIMNPELTFTLPDYQTACGAADIMAHIMERYFTDTKNVELTDRLCEATFKTVVHNVPKALSKPDDYNARAEIMWSGTVAHNNLLNTGRVGDWGSHGIEHEISALYDIAHGAGLAIVFPAWMKYVYKRDINRFAQYAQRMWNIDDNLFDLEDVALRGIAALENYFTSIGMPTRLSHANIDDKRLEEMADKCTASDTKTVGAVMNLNKNDVLNILKLAL